MKSEKLPRVVLHPHKSALSKQAQDLLSRVRESASESSSSGVHVSSRLRGCRPCSAPVSKHGQVFGYTPEGGENYKRRLRRAGIAEGPHNPGVV